MYLNFNSLQTAPFYFTNQLLSSLTPLQKKIVVVAATVLSCMVALALFSRCCLGAKQQPKENNEPPIKESPLLKQPADPGKDQPLTPQEKESEPPKENKPEDNDEVLDLGDLFGNVKPAPEVQIPAKKEEINIEDAEEEDEILNDDLSSDFPLSQQELNARLKKELTCAHHLDVKLGPPEKGSWRKFGEGYGEYNQTCDDYFTDDKADWPDKRPLVIQRIGSFGKCDLKIIAITVDFLKVFHQIPIHVTDHIMTMNELKEMELEEIQSRWDNGVKQGFGERHFEALNYSKSIINNDFPRKNGQYEADYALNFIDKHLLPALQDSIDEKCRVIAFTSEDLYTQDMANFVFGLASLYRGVGIWSNSRFGNPSASPKDFEKCLLRMMKISAHEFGHMRAIPHCTNYECNIGGYMSLPELDRRPLTYCLQDTAKICSLAQTSLLEYNQKLLKFFQTFNKKYELTCDLSKEIKTLKGRIAVLEKVDAAP